MQFATQSSPHLHSANGVSRVMGWVLLALLPAAVTSWWFFGWGVLVNLLLACTTALAAETLILRLRGRPLVSTLSDLSALVTGVLLALALPPLLPWWQTVIGTAFAIIVAKQLFGGLGYNPFNPAMAGYVLLLVSFPVSMTRWLPPDSVADLSLSFGETLRAIFAHTPTLNWDALSSATPLDEMRQQLDRSLMISEIKNNPGWGLFGGQGWEWLAGAYLLGGLILLWRKVISWRIPISMLGGLALIAGLFWLIDPQTHPSPLFHLFSGAAICGAFFIATDPVSASTTPRGQLIYGASIGVLVFIIRSWGGYPDAIAFAVLLMNMAAPTIDYYTQPRVFGAAPKQ